LKVAVVRLRKSARNDRHHHNNSNFNQPTQLHAIGTRISQASGMGAHTSKGSCQFIADSIDR